jgi:hypothetical protein
VFARGSQGVGVARLPRNRTGWGSHGRDRMLAGRVTPQQSGTCPACGDHDDGAPTVVRAPSPEGELDRWAGDVVSPLRLPEPTPDHGVMTAALRSQHAGHACHHSRSAQHG